MSLPSRSIGICFGKMASPHEGLGEYGMQFGEHLARRAVELRERQRIRLHYRLPAQMHGSFGDAVGYLPQWPVQRHLALSFGRYDLWHLLHQHNPFRPPWGVRHCLATVHDLNHLYGSDERFALKATRRLARIADRADDFVAISQHTRRDLISVVGIAKPVYVIPNGVRNLTQVAPERPAGLPAQIGPRRYFFHISRMAPLKNVGALLGMMAGLPDEHLVLAGPRSGDSERIAAEVQAAGLSNITMIYGVSTAEKAWLYQHARAFFFPSLAEGFGLPPVEAMQFGVPVFLSDLTSLPEIGGEVADYWRDFEPKSMQRVLMAGLQRFDAQPQAQAARLRQWAARFTWTACIEQHIALYLRLMEANP